MLVFERLFKLFRDNKGNFWWVANLTHNFFYNMFI
jgi:hypothetical protein